MDISAVVDGSKQWEMFKGDCKKLLKKVKDDTFDVALIDPPYDPKTHQGARSVAKGKKGSRVHTISFDPLKDVEFVHEVLRVTKRWVLVFCPMEMLGVYQAAVGPKQYIRGGVWDRLDGAPQLSGDRPAQAVEGIAVLHKAKKGRGRMKWNGGGKRGIWRHGVERRERNAKGDRLHETPKPIPLLVELLQDFSERGDIVLDCFAGSASTGVAALYTGRSFVGIELDPNGLGYFETSVERLQAAEKLRTLGEHQKKSRQLTLLDRIGSGQKDTTA